MKSNVPQILLGRRAAIAGACIFICLIVIIIGAPVLATYTSQHDEMVAALHQLALYRAEAALRPHLETQLQSLRRSAVTRPGLIAAENTALAQAQLQRDVKKIVEANSGEIRSAQIGSRSNTGGLDIIAIQYDLTLPENHLGAFLYAIETHTPYLFIDHADIAAPVGWQSASNTQEEPQLEVHWIIHAYRWGTK